MMLTILRTAFLAYVRVLLCSCAFLGLAGIVAALLLRRGRRWAAIAAILIEALWATVAAAVGYKTLKDWPLDWQLLWQVTAGAALFLVTIAGLLLPPVRAYAGLVRARGASAQSLARDGS
jgi:uncharacterized membrane protein (UPF0136 family)